MTLIPAPHHATATPAIAGGRGALPSIVTIVLKSVHTVMVRVADGVMAWQERRRQRRALMSFSEHMLKDIGVSRADAEREATRPFWPLDGRLPAHP